MATDPKHDTFDYPTVNPESGVGHPGHTTPEQDEKVLQFRKELEEEGFTENLDTLTLVGPGRRHAIDNFRAWRELTRIIVAPISESQKVRYSFGKGHVGINFSRAADASFAGTLADQL